MIGTLLGCLHCLGLVVRSRFRLRGPYWRWRWETAFGRGVPRRKELARAAIEYARWVGHMRSIR